MSEQHRVARTSFWRTWLAFALAATTAAVLLTIGYWLMQAIWPEPGEDLPPLLAILSTATALPPALLLGLGVAGARSIMLRPRFPYLGWGCLGLFLVPPAFAMIAPFAANQQMLNPIDAELWVLLTLPFFAGFARRLKAVGAMQHVS